MGDNDDFQDVPKVKLKEKAKCFGCRESFSAQSTLITHLKKYKRCRAAFSENEYKRLIQGEELQTGSQSHQTSQKESKLKETTKGEVLLNHYTYYVL